MDRCWEEKVLKKVIAVLFVVILLMPVSADSVLRNANFEYVLDLYKDVEEFGFFKDEACTEQAIGTEENPFEIKSGLQMNTPQFYFLVRSNHEGRQYNLSVISATAFQKDGLPPIGYRLVIDDMDGLNNEVDVAVEEAGVSNKSFARNDQRIVLVDGEPTEWVFGIRYVFDGLEKFTAAEYTATITVGVSVEE